MTARYEKPYLTIDEQLDLLRGRGLDVGDREQAASWLRRVGYYRLSGYWYPLRRSRRVGGARPEILDEFQEGSTLTQVLEIYEFDRKLRLLSLDAIERVEVSVRFHVGHTLGRRGSFAHADSGVLDDDFTGCASAGGEAPALTYWMNSEHRKWLERRTEEERRSKADFVQHFQEKYGLPLPVWVVTEILDFGGLSTLYAGLQQRDRDDIAANLNLRDHSRAGNGGALKSFLRNLNFVRNVSAHHGRLWNLNIVDRISGRGLRPVPELAHVEPAQVRSRLYGSLAVLSFLTRRINPDDDWPTRLCELMSQLPSGRDESEMGFPDSWRNESIWQ